LLNGIGRTNDALWTIIVGSAVSMITGVSLIEVMGVAGAIIGPIMGASVSLAIGTLIVRRRLATELGLTRTWKFYVASAIAAGASWPISWLVHFAQLALVSGAVVFIVLLIPLLALFGALNEADIVVLRGYLAFSVVVSRPLEAAIWYYRLALSSFHRAFQS
jgi:O-antigen/teichoic acid export membrane protein